MSSSKALAVLPLAIALVAVLAGCTADEAPQAAPTAETTETPTAEPTAAPSNFTFTMPTDCASILPESRVDEFAAEGIVLLGGPGGRYGNDYLVDATPEEQAGGISCIWGFSDTEVSSFTISVAPLSGATRPAVVASFAEQGLNEETTDDAVAYGVQGDRTLDPAIMNVLRGESWISVIATIGGLDSYTRAVEISGEVYEHVYSAN
ncbi:hypothetical protein GCM10027413_23770 [Conyzicola nivalis]|uniref:Secreted protein n=1 Tax=Conyzicola nivalis TaxID=1477021 RepID=A0A916SB77_9MICO|nr:hypothetical protein [Conyzicola nivalis]GGA91594.1 hypothetical protein GCM10010979_02850 [Conyzicola nivalis]